jgi:ABC-type phosphate transport system substrate-binding protein
MLLSVPALLAAAGIAPAMAADIKIIANPSVAVSSLSTDDLKAIFLATKSSLEGGSVEPVFEKGGATHEAFLKTYLGKTGPALDTYFRSLVFTGKGAMPKTLSSDADVAAYVAKTKGAIGYVAGGATAAGVKVIEVK